MLNPASTAQPALSRVPTESTSYPFEIITMDFAEFRKYEESFIILGDKYSGGLHLEGMKKGGTSRETINAITTFARSSVGMIKKIVSDQGTQFTSGELQDWVETH